MEWFDFIYLAVFLMLLCSNIVFIIKYFKLSNKLLIRAKKYVDKLYKNHKNARQELIEKETKLQYKEKTANIEYNKLKESFDKKFEKLKNDYEQKKKEDAEELENAIRETEVQLKDSVDQIDHLIEEKIIDLTAKNTLTFDCVCGKKNIPCFIDLSKENTFRCDNCHSVYAVQAKFSPMIIGRATSEEEFNQIIERRLMEEENGDEF